MVQSLRIRNIGLVSDKTVSAIFSATDVISLSVIPQANNFLASLACGALSDALGKSK